VLHGAEDELGCSRKERPEDSEGGDQQRREDKDDGVGPQTESLFYPIEDRPDSSLSKNPATKVDGKRHIRAG
jgi:hypothetical protein